jgi:NMD protein affecting ribosome stability and mRNA decay
MQNHHVGALVKMIHHHCEVCGREISDEEFENFEGMCEDCYTEYLQ